MTQAHEDGDSKAVLPPLFTNFDFKKLPLSTASNFNLCTSYGANLPLNPFDEPVQSPLPKTKGNPFNALLEEHISADLSLPKGGQKPNHDPSNSNESTLQMSAQPSTPPKPKSDLFTRPTLAIPTNLLAPYDPLPPLRDDGEPDTQSDFVSYYAPDDFIIIPTIVNPVIWPLKAPSTDDSSSPLGVNNEKPDLTIGNNHTNSNTNTAVSFHKPHSTHEHPVLTIALSSYSFYAAMLYPSFLPRQWLQRLMPAIPWPDDSPKIVGNYTNDSMKKTRKSQKSRHHVGLLRRIRSHTIHLCRFPANAELPAQTICRNQSP